MPKYKKGILPLILGPKFKIYCLINHSEEKNVLTDRQYVMSVIFMYVYLTLPDTQSKMQYSLHTNFTISLSTNYVQIIYNLEGKSVIYTLVNDTRTLGQIDISCPNFDHIISNSMSETSL